MSKQTITLTANISAAIFVITRGLNKMKTSRDLFLMLVLAKDGLDILQVFDAFVLSNAAARKCEKQDTETLTRFLTNHHMLTGHTRQELKRHYRDRTDAQIDNATIRKSEVTPKNVHAVIGRQGCNESKAKDLIGRFYFHAKWDPLKE